MNRVLVAIIAASVLAAGFALSDSLAQGDAQASEEAQFAGKTLFIQVGSEQKGAAFIERAEFKEIEGRVFLTGIGTESGHPGEWAQGLKIYIDWSTVTKVYEMSPQELEKVRKTMKETHTRVGQREQQRQAAPVVPGLIPQVG